MPGSCHLFSFDMHDLSFKDKWKHLKPTSLWIVYLILALSQNQIAGVTPGISGNTDISGGTSNGKLVTTGTGYDENGDFLERFEFFDIKLDGFSSKMNRPYDAG